MSGSLQIVTRAQKLADELCDKEPKVDRNTLLSLTAAFMSSAQPDAQSLKTMLALLQRGDGGHLTRGGHYADKAKIAARCIDQLLSEGRKAEELKSILGWTARLLLVKSERQS